MTLGFKKKIVRITRVIKHKLSLGTHDPVPLNPLVMLVQQIHWIKGQPRSAFQVTAGNADVANLLLVALCYLLCEPEPL